MDGVDVVVDRCAARATAPRAHAIAFATRLSQLTQKVVDDTHDVVLSYTYTVPNYLTHRPA